MSVRPSDCVWRLTDNPLVLPAGDFVVLRRQNDGARGAIWIDRKLVAVLAEVANLYDSEREQGQRLRRVELGLIAAAFLMLAASFAVLLWRVS